MSSCIICDRPYRRREGDRLPYCQEHLRAFQHKQQENARVKERLSWRHGLRLVLQWQGMAVGLYPGKHDPQTYYPRPLTVSLTSVPKELVVNLDTYCEGYTRQQVKAFKRAIRQAYSLS